MKDGVYVSEFTYSQISEFEDIIVDGKKIPVNEIKIYVDETLPNGYIIFVENGEISNLRTFEFEH